MRHTLSALALSALCLTAACGGDGGTGTGGPSASATTSSPSPSPTAAPLTAAQLDAALLVAADLPAGYQAQGPSDLDPETPNPSASTDPCDLDAEVGETPLRGRETGFLSETSIVNHQVEQYAPGAAATTFVAVRETVVPCKELTSNDGSGASSLTSEELTSAPKLGDESVALRLTGKPGTEEAEFRGIVFAFRIGDVISSVAAFGQGTSPEALVFDAARKAETKLRAVLAGGTGTASASPSASATS